MAARVTTIPARRLTWAAFEPVDSLPNQWSALTQFGYRHKKYTIKRVDHHFGPEDVVITVPILKAQVLRVVREKGTEKQLKELLEHEQGHADLANLGARGIKWEMAALLAPTPGEVESSIKHIEKRHLARVARLHDKYDEETKHGTDRVQQLRWNGLLEAAVQNGRAATVDGLPI
jgi:hypothetical protein